ncbi:MAG: peptide deformylase [Phaeodactylibacter sp.]|nr:peptide deformylase [Phaeodactylibacter sp.]MCB9302811.1 peptide deformylase [Lewinellaceae bacterium]HQU59851.1 peptide deformylase [Saprospiraceae bacterium]
MILPIYAYGQPVLKKMGEEIGPDYPGLKELIENMWETMYNAEGVGLAAPQIGRPIRLFIVDTIQIMEKGKEEEGIRNIFINARKLEEAGEPWTYEEGCLSIPDVRGDVDRQPQLRLRYLDENFEEREQVFTGINARVIQHEYDHIDGILFTDHLKPIKKRLVRRKLDSIKKGKASVEYKMKFPVGR